MVSLIIAAVVVGGLDSASFSRYQAIIDRSPFGATAGVEQGSLSPKSLARFQFVGLVTDIMGSGQLQAVILDTDTSRTFFKAQGEEFDGVKVVRIEQSPPKLVLQAGLETGTLMFRERVNTAAGRNLAATPPLPGSVPPSSTWTRSGPRVGLPRGGSAYSGLSSPPAVSVGSGSGAEPVESTGGVSPVASGRRTPRSFRSAETVGSTSAVQGPPSLPPKVRPPAAPQEPPREAPPSQQPPAPPSQ